MPANPVRKHANPRSVRTRSSLMEAGLCLFAERPVDAVPIDDIVAAAGVAKGSFFNHFVDKQKFAEAIAREIRIDIEARVSEANEDIADPLERLAGGMCVAVEFALSEKRRAMFIARGAALVTESRHPLNAGLRKDIEAACTAGLLHKEARSAGLLVWLVLCHGIMANVIERKLSRARAAERMGEIMFMGLIGLGVDPLRARRLVHIGRERILEPTR